MAYDGKDVRVLKEKGVHAWNRWRAEYPGMWPDLVRADLRGLDLHGVNFFTADLRSADLTGCNLENADLGGSVMIWTNMTDANLQGASLYMANMNGAILSGADLSFATMVETILVDVDLRNVKGLKEVTHLGRSHIGIHTLLRSQGSIPDVFLTGTGMSEELLRRVETFQEEPPPTYYSCFISYSSKDDEFARRLYADLQARKLHTWFAPEDLKIGERFRSRINELIRVHDKLVLILSDHSINSPWVRREVEAAFEREDTQKRDVLFPIRLDDTIFDSNESWASEIKRSRHIGDFRNWKSPDDYAYALERLVRDLKKEGPS